MKTFFRTGSPDSQERGVAASVTSVPARAGGLVLLEAQSILARTTRRDVVAPYGLGKQLDGRVAQHVT